MSGVLFRWALWEPTHELVFMLSHSVASFRWAFGETPRYVVFTENPAFVRAHMLGEFEVLAVDALPLNPRFRDTRCTWRKWAPATRMDLSVTEFRVDADIFMLRRTGDI